MTVHRIHWVSHFTHIPNALLRDDRLSYRARGIMAMVLSHGDGWNTPKSYIEAHGKEGDQAITTAFAELEALGYRRVVRTQGSDGRWSSVTHWFPEPIASDLPTPDLPTPGNPGPGYPGDIEKTIEEDHQEPPPPSSSSSPSVTREDDATDRDAHPPITTPAEQTEDQAFEEWWEAFPKKERILVARAAYSWALTQGASRADLLRGARGYGRLVVAEQRQSQHVQAPASWLRDRRWTDVYPAPGAQRPWYHVAD